RTCVTVLLGQSWLEGVVARSLLVARGDNMRPKPTEQGAKSGCRGARQRSGRHDCVPRVWSGAHGRRCAIAPPAWTGRPRALTGNRKELDEPVQAVAGVTEAGHD